MIRWMGAAFAASTAICAAMAPAGGSARAADLSSMVSVRWDLDASTRTAAVYVTNTGQRAIIGGDIRVVFSYSDGSRKNSDTGFDLLPSVGFESKVTVTDAATHIGALQPGQTHRFLQIGPPADQGVAVVGSAVEARALVFVDNTAVGDPQCIDDLFERWRDQATTFSAWYKRTTGSLSAGPSAAALQQLSTDARAMLARHPAMEPRLRYAEVSSQEEALTRDAGVLEYVINLIDQVRSRVDAHGMSVEEGSAWLREYLRTRTETLTAHTRQKGGN